MTWDSVVFVVNLASMRLECLDGMMDLWFKYEIGKQEVYFCFDDR